MPIPVFLLEFLTTHGRDPRPSELTLDQRRQLRRCATLSRENGANSVQHVEWLQALAGLAITR